MDLLTKNEAALYLQISQRTLARLTDAGELQTCRLGTGLKGRVWYSRGDLTAFVARRLKNGHVKGVPNLREAAVILAEWANQCGVAYPPTVALAIRAVTGRAS
jgi:excisionase family DNA binding protein